MEIVDAAPQGRNAWNRFVRQHYPPVGAFLATWEWGAFQKSLGRTVERYFLKESEDVLAAFTLVHHPSRFGFSYGYVPRGPVIATRAAGDASSMEILRAMKEWAANRYPQFAFVRLEPPLSSLAADAARASGFRIPSYYIQPRYNLVVPLAGAESEIAARFHPSTRSNINRAEKRGVTVVQKTELTETDYREFFAMMRETIARNHAKNVYPSHSYFRSLAASTPPPSGAYDPDRLSLKIFYGYQHGEPAAAHFVVFFGETATYLFGASYSARLNSKVTTYLHWEAMREARQMGLRFYDLGGVDDDRWPTLTNFKRQFQGEEFRYVGNIDIPIRPAFYRAYNFLRILRKSS